MTRSLALVLALLVGCTHVSGFNAPRHGGFTRHLVGRDAEWKKKEALQPLGKALIGDIPVVFKEIGTDKPEVNTMALAGQPLMEVAANANVFINYKCKKGECGTCDVMHDGKWIHTCQTKVPPANPKAGPFTIMTRPGKVKSKSASGFFSPQSFVDGFTANALGMVGLVTEGAKEDGNFDERMKREKELQEKLAEKKRQRAGK
mmetsp:Transcript_58694/g.132843  ORF Transcript_58694/g.132843 Transcript_58694/m.132843 type:complete len:203 (+) Transcript_58694:133-741(+)|eukprot:CAMPEP_0172616070 /NCGR_PEP_ID=MMETSP1068-20121228/62689_1 /TAXON_ID=35684 /ORGANISM="Pseudopedinella elastica, Strain CCMP716" /LENGTH=202 /DNA_ID=CAMNT_0013421397 /DNA_START=128 /DNA_END=736 /DNA_ORIENTATION=-